MNTATLDLFRDDAPRPIAGDPAAGWPARLREALVREPGPLLLLLSPGTAIDPTTFGLMREALENGMGFDAVSPIAEAEVRQAWGLAADAHAVLEAWTWAPHRAIPAPADPRCALWTRAAAERVVASGSADGTTTVRLPHVVMTSEDVDGAPVLREHWRPRHLATGHPSPTAAGRDGRPVILHVLHDWGGGVARFVGDQMREDPEATHLALVSHGDVRGGFGRQLRLHTDLARCPIRIWEGESPVGDMAEQHPTVAEALTETLASFGVSALRVSSLIGSSLDVLRTGLPTAFVVHDAFPFWPWLDDTARPPAFDPSRLEAAARESGWLFSERDPAVWQQRIATLCARLAAPPAIMLVAPSRSALQPLQDALPAPVLQRASVIPHGIPMATAERTPLRRPGPLRVLVPGRLKGAKGERLLDALLPIAPAGIVWCFAGGDALAEAYAQRTGGEAVGNYTEAELAALVARFDPDMALLPSLLPETFGYVLSEMQALQVPVLAAAVGAYGERLAEMPLGIAPVAPDAKAFAEALAGFIDAPGSLPRRLPPPPRLDASRKAWRQLQRLPAMPTRTLGWDRVAGMTHERGILAASVDTLRRERDEAYIAHGRDTGDLIHQRDIAMARIETLMQDQAREREQAAELRSDFEGKAQHVAALNREVETIRATFARDIESAKEELRQLAAAIEKARVERDAAYGYYERDTADLIRQRDTALSQRDAAEDLLARALRTLSHPMIRLPLRLRERSIDAVVAWRYRAAHGLDLLRRGLRSLRQRGFAATWAAVRRRFSRGASPLPTAPLKQAPLAFDAPRVVRASLVIPVYGKLDFTLACLQSLASTALPPGTEVIVVDDASPDGTGEALPRIPGLRYHRNAQNLGFVGSCNAGAAMARGEFLVFLNNDTTLTPGWLEALLSTFDTHPDTGLAGAQLVYPDGRLQESGGIVFSDGSGWNYGRFEDPMHPAFTFVREVDYCSGAAIALRRTVFEALGGFDERYAPAYYEDTDLAMKVREAGMKVRVQPASVVVHHEGVTAGTDTGSGVKAYQVRNQQRFVERWRDTLMRRHPAPSQAPHYAAQHRARARVLVIDATTPMPDRDSGSVRLFELLRLLAEEGCAVTFFPENGLDDGRYTQALKSLGVEAWTQPWLGALPDWLAKHGPRFQLVIVSRHYVLSPLLPLLRRHAPQARIVFDTVDLHHLREQREAEERSDAGLRRIAAKTRADELALIATVDRTWVVSPFEKALLAEALPGATVDVVSNIHRVRGAGPGMREREGLLFVGGFRHPPNVDAALWLANDLLPRIRAVRPDIGLSLVGSDAPAEILALDSREGIRVHGHVPDLEPLLDGHRFSVAPLRYGAGVKGKVNQALAHGLPVVATRCAVEGMGLAHGVDVLVADDAEAFANLVLAAYEDDTLWQALVTGGLANTEREFSPERARQTLRAIFNDLR